MYMYNVLQCVYNVCTGSYPTEVNMPHENLHSWELQPGMEAREQSTDGWDGIHNTGALSLIHYSHRHTNRHAEVVKSLEFHSKAATLPQNGTTWSKSYEVEGRTSEQSIAVLGVR